MNKFTKVTLIIAAVLAGLGILFCGIASILGLRYGTLRNMAMNGEFNIGNVQFRDDYYESESGYVDRDYMDENAIAGTEQPDRMSSDSQTFSIDRVKNLKMSVGAAVLRFKESTDTSAISVILNRGYEKYYECGMDGDTLTVKYKKENYFFNERKPEITVYIPRGMSFADINLDIGAAEADFDTEIIACENLTINVGAGVLDASGLSVAGMTDVIIGVGTVELDDGSYRDIKLECGMGELSLGGRVSGNITAHCGMGTMELDINGRESDYNYDLSCGMGELMVNGTSYSAISGSRKLNNDGAIGTLSLDCGMGNIDVEIEMD